MARFDDASPIYRQIAEQIKADILSGTLLEEEQVMSTNQYATFYRINPATAARAFQQLAKEGVLYKKRGIGMFVKSGSRAALRRERQRAFAADWLMPLIREATYLGMELPELLSRLEQAHAAVQQADPKAPHGAGHD